jgi:tripeptide aminopeptidase
VRLAADIVAALPSDRLTPDTTAEREGFIHVYSLTGTAAVAEIRAIVRDFDEELLDAHVALLQRAAREVSARHPRATVEVTTRRQYRNMRAYLEAVPFVADAAEAAISAEGVQPLRMPARGGTDGSRLSEMGLPTPNIFTGGHEYHSVREWASLQDMAAAAATVIRLAEVWTRPEWSERDNH